MCNLYRLETSASELASPFNATIDPSNELTVEEDCAAPRKPGFVIREKAGQRPSPMKCMSATSCATTNDHGQGRSTGWMMAVADQLRKSKPTHNMLL